MELGTKTPGNGLSGHGLVPSGGAPDVTHTSSSSGAAWWLVILLALLAAALGVAIDRFLRVRARHQLRARPAVGSQPVITVPLPDLPAAQPGPVAPTDNAARRPLPRRLIGKVGDGSGGLAVDGGIAGRFRVYAATQVGPAHERGGAPREDSYSVAVDNSGRWTVLVVADGVSSSRNAHAAAQLATTGAAALLRARLAEVDPELLDPPTWERLSREIVEAVATLVDSTSVDRRAAELGHVDAVTPRPAKLEHEPACTLVFAALAPPAAGGEFRIFAAGVGDSDIFVLDLPSRVMRPIIDNPTKNGPVTSNVTSALPNSPFAAQSVVELVPAGTVVLLATDGCADAIRVATDQYATILARHVQAPPAPRVFAELVDFDLPGLFDDRTLLAAWSLDAPAGPE
jgi:serine/threonine protein phosphatase PrpC